MNRTRIIIVIAIAFLLAGIASVGIYRYLSEKGSIAEQARLQTVGIVVAVEDISLGTTIKPNMVAVAAWPKDRYPQDSFVDTKAVEGRVAKRDFVRGEPIVESKLVPTDKGAGGILALKVPEGMRAFSIRVNEVVGVGGFIVPDTRVDVLVTTTPSQGGGRISKIVLENILVLAAGQTLEQKDNKPITVNTVTVAVSPNEAEKLALASNEGIIQLVLRNYMDPDNVVTMGATTTSLLASYRPSAPAPEESASGKQKRSVRKKASSSISAPVKKTFTVEVIKGNQRSEEKFQ
jgi:pilus assembly protein CpaB